MASQDLGFNVFAHDRAGATFAKLSQSVERLSDKLRELDRQRANPEIEVDTQKAMAQARRAARAFASAAEDEGGRHRRGFFLTMFTPNRGIITALRTGIPAALGSPIGAAAIVLAGVFTASFAAAVVSSGVFALIGGGFTAIAAVVLKENQRLKDSFADLAQTVQSDLTQAAQPLVPVFDAALSQVRAMFGDHITAPLEDIFSGLAPSIVGGVESAVRTVGNVLDALSTPEFLESTRDILDAISAELPRLGDEIGGFFTTLAKNSDDIAEAFGNVVTVTGGLLQFAARATNAFTDLFNVISDLASIDPATLPGPWQAGADPEEARSTLEHIQGANAALAKAIPGVSDPIGDALVDYVSGAEEAAGATGKLEAEIAGLQRRGEQAAQEGLAELQARQEQLTEAIDGTNEQIDHERDRLEQLKDSMFSASERVLGLRDSTRSYEEAIDAARESLEENGETLDVNTEKGRANQEAIDDIAASALGHIEMMIRQGEETDKVSQFTQQAREDFINAADAAGLETEEAEKLADQLGLVPSEVETKIEAIDEMSDTIDSLKRQLRELQRQAGVIPVGTSTGAFFGSALVPPSEFHAGGIIGQPPRAHSGMRLASDERVIIGQTGERILSREQNRAYEAGARMGGGDGATAGGSRPTINVENFHAAPNMDVGEVAERFWFLTKARG